MRRIVIHIIIVLMAAALLSACSASTVEQMYCLPERSEEYQGLQSAINAAMSGREFSSPRSGENQQAVQMSDLDGDGILEYLVFTRGSGEHPLQVLVFTRTGEDYVLLDAIDSQGTAFDQVEYVQVDGKAGYDLVVGSQLTEEVIRSVAVYSFSGGEIQQLLSTNYTKYVPIDLDQDHVSELLILRPGDTEGGQGVAEYYTYHDGTMERSVEVSMSQSAANLKRVIQGTLNDGTSALYAASSVDENSIITDVFAIVDGSFRNVTFSNESGTSVQTLRNYFVYAEDIDKDGVIELPDLIPITPVDGTIWYMEKQHLIRWYSMNSDGGEVDKLYTYHNFGDGWYLILNEAYSGRISVTQNGTVNEFFLWDEGRESCRELMSIYTLTGQNREEQAEDKIVLYQGDSVIYAAELFISPENYQSAAEELTTKFHLIHRDWKTGET